MYDQELYHYGIKGMKWGIRRFQKQNGTLTTAGKQRYLDDEKAAEEKKQSIHRQLLENKYRKQGMSEVEAKLAANKRIKIEKVVAVTAGVTVAACAAYYAKNKYVQTYCDTVLKAGTQFHNLDAMANERPGEHLYVNYRQNDTNFFRGQFALGKLGRTGEVWNHTLTATEDIKIPSINTRKSVFKQLYESDKEFRETFNVNSRLPKDANTPRLAYKQMWMKFGNKDNEVYNVAKRKYFEALRQKGYEAIVDEWDTRRSVYGADAPLILLNTSAKSFGSMKISQLTDKDILLGQANSRNYASVRTLAYMYNIPHNNNFKESSKKLSRAAAKSAKNSANIDRALSAMGIGEEAIRSKVFKKQGSVLADTGKYLDRHKNMSVKTAHTIATAKRTGTKAALTVAELGGSYVGGYVAANMLVNRQYVQKYVKEHPNTKLTYNEILRTREKDK